MASTNSSHSSSTTVIQGFATKSTSRNTVKELSKGECDSSRPRKKGKKLVYQNLNLYNRTYLMASHNYKLGCLQQRLVAPNQGQLRGVHDPNKR